MPAESPDSVSVVMPCYNGMPYLPQALDSALAQTHRPVQIIVVDDGSKDDSAACVRDYMQRFPGRGLQLIKQANGGEPVARNTGIRAATGAWVAMLDADDWWEPQKLARQLEAAAAAGPECVLVHTAGITEYPDGRSMPGDVNRPARRTGWCLRALLEPGSIGHPSIMVRRTALEQIGGYDESFRVACDINLYFHLARIGTFAYVPEHLLHYRIHPRQLSALFKLDEIRAHWRAIDGFFKKFPDEEAKVGRAHIEQDFAQLIATKLESLYWHRRMGDFRGLLAFAREIGIDSPAIAQWRKRSRIPDWLIAAKDRLTGAKH